jgi:F0F1-type ATP synthase membrane subunit b/b'
MKKKKDPNNHKVVPLDKYTNYCPLHRHKFSAYCFDCKKNTCVKCTEHRQHKKYHFDDYLLFDDDVKKYKKEIIDLRTNCENLESQVNTILDKIRSEFHEEMQKQINILSFNELLLDAYQTNQFNYFYLQNVLNNFSNLENVEKKVNNQDIKQLLTNLINNCNLLEIDQITKVNQTHGELLHVSQPTQMTKQIKALDYNKDTVQDVKNPTFNIEANKSLKNNDIIMEMNDSKNSSMMKNNDINQTSFKSTKKDINNLNNTNKSIKNNLNETNKSIRDINNETNKSIRDINNETNKSIKNINNETNKSIRSINNLNNETNKSIKSTKKSIKSSVKKENSSQTPDNLIDSFQNENGGNEIDINDLILNQSSKLNNKLSCEFIGKNIARDNYNLNDLPNNVEAVLEIRNTGNINLPKGCYLYDENNCSALMILDNVINSIEPGKTIYKQLKFDIYIYSKGSYHVKLAVKDPNGVFISSNRFEYTLVIE